ncbi:MAG TPA: hypothetical protein PKD38_18795 [Nitrospira sp.]|nr:hypothetical protein [Nitrospira sp.]
MKKLKFQINKQGVATLLDAEGYGPTCQKATENIERRLGVVDESSRASTGSLYAEPEHQAAYQAVE